MNCKEGNLGSLAWYVAIFLLFLSSITHGKEQLRFRRGTPIEQRPSRPNPNKPNRPNVIPDPNRPIILPPPVLPPAPRPIQRPSSSRIPITQVGRSFISLLENSGDESLVILAEEYKSALVNLDIENLLISLDATNTKPNDQNERELNIEDLQKLQRWQDEWKLVKAYFVKNIDENSDIYEEGMAYINQAITYNPNQSTPPPPPPLPPPRNPLFPDFGNTGNDIQDDQDQGKDIDTSTSKSDDYKYIVPSSIAGVIIFLIVSIAVGVHLVLLKRFEFRPHIDNTQLKFARDLGCGNFARVCLVRYQPNPRADPCLKKCLLKPVLAAAKFLSPDGTSDAQPTVFSGSVQGSVDEIVVRKLKHMNIVRIFGLCLNFQTVATTTLGQPGIPSIQCKTIATIFEYMDLGDCEEYLKKHCSMSKSPHMAGRYLLTVCSIFQDVSEAFIYLRGKKIVHRDLAPRNVFVRSKNGLLNVQAKVGDFGLAKLMKQRIRLDNGKYCDAYIGLPNEVVDTDITPPEAKTSQPQFTTYSDVYSFGMFILVCINFIKDVPTTASSIPANQYGAQLLTEPIPPTPYAQIEQIGNTIHQQSMIPSNSDHESGDTVPCEERMPKNIQKAIHDIQSLAALCTKMTAHERITFENSKKAMLALRMKYRKMGIGKKNIDHIDSVL